MRAFWLVVLAASVAQAEVVDRVAAVVNNDIIALSEVEQRIAPELQRINQEKDAGRRKSMRDEMVKRALDQLVGEKLLEAAMRELAIEVTDQDIDFGIEDVKRQNNLEGEQFEQLLRTEGYTLTSYREFMRKHLGKLKLINLKVRSKVKVSEEDLRAEYAEMAKRESEDAEVHARHLLVQLPGKPTNEQVEAGKKKALELAAEAKKPGVDFAALAKAKSEGPSAKEGGDLGFFRRGVMVPEFERAAFSLPVGGVSEPIRTKFGWHVIKIEEKRALAARPFEEMKEQLKDRLIRNQLEKYTDQYVGELRQQAVVEVKI
jgi:peptidyl-prolyl cis-trans isomerase SurA